MEMIATHDEVRLVVNSTPRNRLIKAEIPFSPPKTIVFVRVPIKCPNLVVGWFPTGCEKLHRPAAQPILVGAISSHALQLVYEAINQHDNRFYSPYCNKL